MDQKPLNLAIVGCGNIAESYCKSLQPYPQLNLLGATSRTLKHAENFVATFGGRVYPSLEAILADEKVDLVINLTTAKTIGLTIPDSLLLRADQVIE